MARLIYACRFQVPASEGAKPVLSAYGDWISRHYVERRGLSGFTYNPASGGAVPELPPGHTLIEDHFVGATGEITRLIWAYPADGDGDLEWRNEIRVGVFGENCAVEHLILINSIDYRITPTRLSLGSPAVIRQLCSETAVQIGDMQIKATPYPLHTKDVDRFIELLQSPKRRLPIVFVSPYADGEPNALDESLLAQHLAGVAVVVTVSDLEATRDITDALGKTLSCFDGGVRIYWPGFSIKDDPRSHRLYLGARITLAGPEAVARSIEKSIFAVAAFRFVPDPLFNEVINAAEQAERLQRVEVQKASSGDNWESYAIELDEKLSVANQMISDLQAENKNLKENHQIFFSSRMLGEAEEDIVSEDVAAPTSIEEALGQAKTKKNLIILDSAFEAAKDSPFQRPAEILAALEDLDEISAEWVKQHQETGSGGDILQALKNRGWGKRSSMHISNTTRKQYGSHYKFAYKGERQLFEPHITLGSGDANSCASIHFLLDQSCGKIVIGHVGRHLPNTKT